MIRFLIKGLLRDRQRSKLPIIVTAVGVMLTVFLYCYITGVMGDTTDLSARFETGHLRIISKAYHELEDQIPNDLALTETDALMKGLNESFSDMQWVERIRYGGLIDVPDENGETRIQGPVSGMAIDLFSNKENEIGRLNIDKSLVRGSIPDEKGEILISDQFAKNLKVNPGDKVTLISSTMFGGMAIHNFKISGTVKFGTTALDRGSMIADISDIRFALNMEDATSEILGYFGNGYYDDEKADEVKKKFTEQYMDDKSEFAPMILKLKEQSDMAKHMASAESLGAVISVIFILAMSLVLWNAGLIGGLRRYGEFGLRLAIGEEKRHVYKTLIYESVITGIAGTIAGMTIGLILAYILQEVGFNVEGFMKDSSMLLPSRYRARITPPAFYIGFIPGVFSAVIGTMLSGIGIFKRKTAVLFKELEN